MKITCEYCGSLFDDTLEKCPNCGGTNRNVRRSTVDQPTTIEELKQWYVDRGLPPYETTRFFIGENHQGPRAFGIYKDGDNFIVYKNKDNGSRAVRYEGTDEAYAVNELFQRLKQEIVEQKLHQANNHSASGEQAERNQEEVRQMQKQGRKNILRRIIKAIVICYAAYLILAGAFGLIYARTHVTIKDGYYQYDNTTYYHDTYNSKDYWYVYDDDNDDWSKANRYDVPGDLRNRNSENFYDSPTWDPKSQYSDFSDELAEYQENYTSSYSGDSWYNDDSSSYDWGSNDSWDSGSTDWGSDW